MIVILMPLKAVSYHRPQIKSQPFSVKTIGGLFEGYINDDYHKILAMPSIQPSNKSPSLAQRQKNQLRIIGGKWRGRKLAIADIDGLRPTGDRIRETVFNWLMGRIVESRCVDLFAGSGALGLECLSRGAAEVTLLEKHPLAVSQLRQHCQLLDAKSAKVVECDTLLWLEKATVAATGMFDIVFIDPPFAADLWAEVIAKLDASNILSPNAIIYMETSKNHLLRTPAHWQLLKEKQSGQVCYRLYQCDDNRQ